MRLQIPLGPSSDRPRRPGALLLSVFLLAAGCGGSEPAAPEETSTSTPELALPDRVEVPSPDRPVTELELVEDHSEAVANRLVDLADKLRRRDFGAALDWFDGSFAAHGLVGLAEPEVEPLPLDAERHTWDVTTAPVVGRDGFLAGLQEWIGPWKRVETVVWKVKAAEFQTGRPVWGTVRLKITVLGTDERGGPRHVSAWARTRVEKILGEWRLTHLGLESLKEERREAYLFSDVSAAAGVAHAGIRFGQPGNERFAWNGAAAGDADGDGLYDLFVPSAQRNFLYIARDDDGVLAFDDQTEERGVGGSAGGTGCVFFDLEGDGDQDLALADVGWREPDGAIGGNRLRFYRNGGEGKFEEAGAELGFDRLAYGYTLVVLDRDLDGFLDLYLCNYGRPQAEPNNSWLQASNGMPNVLFANDGGTRLVDATEAAGMADSSWSYAAAAADFDVDGDQDLYVANDYGHNHLWRNDGAGGFADAAEALGVRDLGNGMGTSWGDLDNDGGLDLYVANMSSTAGNRILRRLQQQDGVTADLKKMAAGNSVFLAHGEPRGDSPGFERLSRDAGGVGGAWAWSPALFDLDLDGRLDVFNANGFVTGDTAADT
ncbi:MAG: VCBS repeat-containing protein [Planctomycetota bacterium]